jgi:hypothetical protein
MHRSTADGHNHVLDVQAAPFRSTPRPQRADANAVPIHRAGAKNGVPWKAVGLSE